MPLKAAPITWDSSAVAKALRSKGIQNRDHLARAGGLPRSTVYRQFDKEWNGQPTTAFLGAICDFLGVSASRLIATSKAA